MMGQFAFASRALLTLLLMGVGALVMLLVAVLTGFQLRRFYSEGMATPLARMALRLWGIRMMLHQAQAFPTAQTVYVSNHTSTIDLFVLLALGLPNARFFLSGFLRKLLPLGLIGYLIGIFWTVPQSFPEKRREIFRRATEVLRKSGESVYLSPEGERVTTGLVGPFNKGSFHLATALKAPIVPIVIVIPEHINPGRGLNAGAGDVQIYVQDAIPTTRWREEDVVANKEHVRDLFMAWNAQYRSTPSS